MERRALHDNFAMLPPGKAQSGTSEQHRSGEPASFSHMTFGRVRVHEATVARRGRAEDCRMRQRRNIYTYHIEEVCVGLLPSRG